MRDFLLLGVVLVALSPACTGLAHADPAPVADVTQSAQTTDGWHVSVALSNMTINSVPNMAATAFTREAFVTGKAKATIDGNGRAPVNSGTLILGAQLGCQVDLSEGGSLSGGGDIGVGFGFGNSILAVSPSPYAELDGNVSVNLLPGNITNVGLGRKALKGPIGEISIHDAHVKVDGCGGPVVMRFFATVTTDTDKSDDSVNTYGDILNI